ncbi:type 2 lantipeptide synthetase LanM [Nostoc spongiaeforme FACHB-130]|uniref:Type 2 lantipeptide synthetase LanM n=1 Tax=Nostoc spongiaeforme FACHB-130 TaxID=1357510 RepID=A0ABR8FTP8_9NOSO|nr:type 2 lanthipeptide synthetase LanM family protein [Nostoc spongiaeforme]MBD2593607.1 type 2 lantipeptide synthetase LanM [Nostoc spongiaeforme FACHB-130]
MNQLFFESSNWYFANTLAERISSLHTCECATQTIKIQLAQQRIQKWRSQFPLPIEPYFQKRLKMDGITEQEFLYLLGESIESVYKRQSVNPKWLTDLISAFSSSHNEASRPLPQIFHKEAIFKFSHVIEQLIHQALERIHHQVKERVESAAVLPFNWENIDDILCACLPSQLLKILNRTMVLELNVARLQGLLKGNTPDERFNSFIERLRQPDIALAILQEYPVLARQITICLNNWVNSSLEFLHHLCKDWQKIQTIFSPENDLGVLVAIDGNVGDRHRKGRSVLIAKFSSGLQIVYKPKSLAVDVHFQEFLTWLNQRGDHPPFQTLKILDCGTYGWVEFVSAKGCSSTEEIWRFYERQGGYLALLYLLEATDFHSENIIAAGEHPILLDLEALFHQRVGGLDETKAKERVISTFSNSVFSTGLLPYRTWSNAESEGVDISGLGASAGQMIPYEVPKWEGVGTDEMHLVRQKQEIPKRHNRPTLNGRDVNLLDYADAIVQGFTQIYQLLLKHRDELLSDQGPLSRFAEDEVRIVIRATSTYSLLLYEGFHPDMLRNALERDRLFDRLWSGVETDPQLIKIIPTERDDLQNGDIPMFLTRPNSRDLWTSSGEKIVNYFDKSGATLVQERTQQLSPADLEKQLWVIRASLATSTMGADRQGSRWPAYSLTEPQTITNQISLLAAARAIGDRLETLTFHGESDISWIGITVTERGNWTLAPVGMDVYDGVSGIALFLAYLGTVTGEEKYTKLAQSALTTLQLQIKEGQAYLKSIGGFNGWGGMIYTFTHLARLWNKPDLLAEAEKLVEFCSDLIEQDEMLDIIGGTAGYLASLISLYQCQPSSRTLDAAIECGEHLLAKAQPMKHGIGWVNHHIGEKPLTGFSHGNAGIAWTLLELAALTGEHRFQIAALAAINYERSLFCPTVENWPDLRKFSQKIAGNQDNNFTCMTAWCHGAPGIGLARLLSLPYIDDAEIRSEINTALKTTINQGFGHNHSLCHGDLGNLELLLQASLTLDEPQWKTQVDRFAAAILEGINQHSWLCGVPLGVETPGLMTGLAGIGYELLRLATPEIVPSVLGLEPPKVNK